MARLSKPQAFHLNPVVEQPRTASRERGGDRRLRVRRTVTEQAAAAAGAADLCCGRSGRAGSGRQIIDDRCRHTVRESFAVLPLVSNLTADFIPVASI